MEKLVSLQPSVMRVFAVTVQLCHFYDLLIDDWIVIALTWQISPWLDSI